METTPNLSFKGFKKRGGKNPHGWGLAFYPDQSAQIIKEPLTSTTSKLADFISKYEAVTSKIVIGHVRYSSRGVKSHKNTHPFDRELHGKHYVFAHNGTLHSYQELGALEHFMPLGETDSEYAFCYLLNRLASSEISLQIDEEFDWLFHELRLINEKGTFNTIFSDGTHLFCYHDKEGHNGLFFLHREYPFGPVRLIDDDWEVNLDEMKNRDQKGYVIATRPLTNESWQRFEPGELIVFQSGSLIYRSNKKENSHLLDNDTIQVLRVIRTSNHRVSIQEIADKLAISTSEVTNRIHSLINQDYVKQDSHDEVPWDNMKATFYSQKSKRKEIDEIIR